MTPATIDRSLHQLMHAYHRAMRQCYRAAGLERPLAHLRILKVLDHLDQQREIHCTAQAIATRVDRDKAQIARVVKELEADGLIEKRDNPEDRRSHLLRLTAPGRAALEAIRQAEQAASQSLTRGLNLDELETFIRLSQRMAQNLSQADTSTNKNPSAEDKS